MGVPPVKIGPHPFLFFDDRPKAVLYGRDAILQWKSYALLPNREWNPRQKHKKQPWSKMECFAFGGATVRFASLPSTTQSLRHPLTRAIHVAPRIKTARRFTAKKPLMVKNFLEGG